MLALDVGDLTEALRVATLVKPWFATAKVGYELYAEAGPSAFDALQGLGLQVFADLKLHDIPNTVARGARVLGRHGVRFLNFHASGGVAMLKAGVDAFKEGGREGGHDALVALGVTVLTSEANADAFDERLRWSSEAGCDGVVCAADEVRIAHAAKLRTMVPGIRLPGQDTDDQARPSTPERAIADGADWLVIGRAVTRADDPSKAAETVHALVERASLSQ